MTLRYIHIYTHLRMNFSFKASIRKIHIDGCVVWWNSILFWQMSKNYHIWFGIRILLVHMYNLCINILCIECVLHAKDSKEYKIKHAHAVTSSYTLTNWHLFCWAQVISLAIFWARKLSIDLFNHMHKHYTIDFGVFFSSFL